jgi:hypothetical protein
LRKPDGHDVALDCRRGRYAATADNHRETDGRRAGGEAARRRESRRYTCSSWNGVRSATEIDGNQRRRTREGMRLFQLTARESPGGRGTLSQGCRTVRALDDTAMLANDRQDGPGLNCLGETRWRSRLDGCSGHRTLARGNGQRSTTSGWSTEPGALPTRSEAVKTAASIFHEIGVLLDRAVPANNRGLVLRPGVEQSTIHYDRALAIA